jgi:hypothetical protein
MVGTREETAPTRGRAAARVEEEEEEERKR